MRQWLSTLNNGLPKNAKLRLREQGKNRIHLTPLDRQIEPPNTTALKREIGQRWDDLELIDIIKEVDLRENFSALFRTSASREVLEPEILQRRLLLCLFGLGTNVGLKRVASQQPSVSYDELRYVKRRFIKKDALRSAISHIVNGILHIRQPTIWGNATTSCAADSRKFGAYDQNLMTEWHARYGEHGEFTSNRTAEQELSMLSLHLLQISLVYINTLLIQNILSEPAWRQRMTEEDWRGLTPLIYHHVNPYGRIELNMDQRLALAA